MFDWNDEELTNIIWGEAGESDDHIVPYPDQIEEKPSISYGDAPKKETKQQTSNTTPTERKNPPTKAEYGVGLDSNSKYYAGEPATGTSWSDGPDPSASDVAKGEQDSAAPTLSKNITKNSESGSLIEETSQFKKDSEIFENLPEDGEQGDIVDYGWANIGSFYDLDRIFSNQNPIFGDTDELWSPSKDVTSSCLGTAPLSGDSSDHPFGALRASTDGSEIKAEYMLDTSQTFTSQASSDIHEYLGGKSNLLGKEKTPAMSGERQTCLTQLNDETASTAAELPDKANRQKRLLKGQKLIKKSNANQLHNLSGSWTSTGNTLQLNSQFVPSTINPGPPLVLTQQSSLSRPEPFQQNYFLYGNMANHENMCTSYELQPTISKSSEDAAAEPPPMTPREKIEKLRRRQQIRAIHAIQKQQMQFNNQVSVSEQQMGGGKNEVNEPNSPSEQYDSNTIGMTTDNCSEEESVLHRLQDTIDKLDIRIRLGIGDSLFRLAQSAVQRLSQSHNDMSSNKDEALNIKDIVGHERFTRMPDMETDTNPIDRIVAHLLFHRPIEFTGKPADAADSPSSANLLLYEKEPNPSKSLMTSERGDTFCEGDQSNNGPTCQILKMPAKVE